MPAPTTCTNCGGSGYVGDSLCDVCMGQGSLPVRGLPLFMQEKIADMEDKLNDIMDKCNDIFEAVTEP